MPKVTMTGMYHGKKRRMVHKKSRRQTTYEDTPRTAASRIRTNWAWGERLHKAKRRSVVPKMSRRKHGARRKATLIESIIKWVPVKIGVRRTTRRRR